MPHTIRAAPLRRFHPQRFTGFSDGTATDQTETVDTGLDRPLHLPRVRACVERVAADHVGLPKKRIQTGAFALVEEQVQVALGGILNPELFQGSYLALVETVLIITDSECAHAIISSCLSVR